MSHKKTHLVKLNKNFPGLNFYHVSLLRSIYSGDVPFIFLPPTPLGGGGWEVGKGVGGKE